MDSARYWSSEYFLPFSLIMAIANVESGQNKHAVRFERHYRYLFDVGSGKPFRKLSDDEIMSKRAPYDFPFYGDISSRDTEWVGQQCSWGAMQVMGAVAREHGFQGRFPELCGDAGIKYGCLHLSKLRERFLREYGWRGVIAAYNAGSPRKIGGAFVNQKYVDAVVSAGGLESYNWFSG